MDIVMVIVMTIMRMYDVDGVDSVGYDDSCDGDGYDDGNGGNIDYDDSGDGGGIEIVMMITVTIVMEIIMIMAMVGILVASMAWILHTFWEFSESLSA